MTTINNQQPATYTSYVIRNTKRRQYLNEASPREGRWDNFGNASVFFRESDAIRKTLEFNRHKTTAEVVPVQFFYNT